MAGAVIYAVETNKMNKDEIENVEENVIGFGALYESMEKCKRKVMWKDSVARYYLNGIEETLKLERQLKEGTYKARKPVKFKITSPKPREIASVAYRDRVYQRSLNDNVIYPQMSRSLIYDNGACQREKGTDFARNRLKCFLQKYYRRYGMEGYILQCDIKGYYPNMRHDAALKKFRKMLDSRTYGRTKEILEEQYEGETGYNPGSQMVQIAGISLLDELDHCIKEKLRIKYYLRYMDDFILIHQDREYLEYCKTQIGERLEEIGMEFNEKKTQIRKTSDGILFLGFVFRLTQTGKAIMTIDPAKIKQERKKLRSMVAKAKRGELTKKQVNDHYAGFRNHVEKGNSFKALRKMDKYYKELWVSDQKEQGK